MANFRGKSTKGVDLAVAVYDKSVAIDKETQEVKAQYVNAGIHPDSPLAQGPDQTILALNSKRDENSKSGYNNSAPYSGNQYEQMLAAAGDNVAPLLNKDGETVGKVLGLKADLIPARDKSGMAINTKTLAPSELSVGEIGGKDIQTRTFETQVANKAAKDEQKAAPVAEAEAEPERELVAAAEAQSELGG